MPKIIKDKVKKDKKNNNSNWSKNLKITKANNKKDKYADNVKVWSISEILLTKDGFEKLKNELKHLKTIKRKEVSERLKEAISFWDLSENSEYEDAKNEQAFVEWRIIELEKKIKNAKIISDTHANKINIWSTIEVERLWTKLEERYTIVWTTEAEPFEWRISNESPLWLALIWLKKWDVANVIAPKWNVSYKVLKIL